MNKVPFLVRVSALLLVALLFILPEVAKAQASGCDSSCHTSYEGGYEHCVNSNGVACDGACCTCWITSAAGLNPVSKELLKDWEETVWRVNRVLRPLNLSYRNYIGWGRTVANWIIWLRLEDEARIGLELLANAVSH